MLGQTFELFDLVRILVLVFLEIALSVDNALVLGLISKAIAKEKRQKALLIGLFSAFLFRIIAIIFVSTILQYGWIQAVGALYLFYLSARFFWKKSAHPVSSERSFWKTVWLIELSDLAFAADSILAGVAFISSIPSTGKIHPKLWIVYTGAVIGLIAIRFAARIFSDLLDRFPRLERSAHLMIGWIGCKLLINAIGLPSFEPIFWTILALLFIFGFKETKKNG
jgi:YkoY family integral membrane protein